MCCLHEGGGAPPAARQDAIYPPRYGSRGLPTNSERAPKLGPEQEYSCFVLPFTAGQGRAAGAEGGSAYGGRRPRRRRRTAERSIYPPLSFGKPRETGGRKAMGAKPARGAGRPARLLKKANRGKSRDAKPWGLNRRGTRRQASPAAEQSFSKPLETMGRTAMGSKAASSRGGLGGDDSPAAGFFASVISAKKGRN